MAYPAMKVAIEFDGWDAHRLRRHFDDDRARTIELQLAGWLVLPFTSRSTETDVVDAVRRALAQRSG
jgi:very-short-patch-repair endonuclease